MPIERWRKWRCRCHAGIEMLELSGRSGVCKAIIRQGRRRSLNWKGGATIERAGTLGAKSLGKPLVGETVGGHKNGEQVGTDLQAS